MVERGVVVIALGEGKESSGGYAVVVVQRGSETAYSIKNAENSGKTRTIVAAELEAIAQDLRRIGAPASRLTP